MAEYKRMTIEVPDWLIERAKLFYPREDEPLAVEFYILNKLEERK